MSDSPSKSGDSSFTTKKVGEKTWDRSFSSLIASGRRNSFKSILVTR